MVTKPTKYDSVLEEVQGSSYCKYSLLENNQARLYRNQKKIYNKLEEMLTETRGNKMSINYIVRSHDEEIIDIVRSVMDNGTGKAETGNEHILIKLMQLRGTPMTSFEFDQKKVDFHYNQWKSEKAI